MRLQFVGRPLSVKPLRCWSPNILTAGSWGAGASQLRPGADGPCQGRGRGHLREGAQQAAVCHNSRPAIHLAPAAGWGCPSDRGHAAAEPQWVASRGPDRHCASGTIPPSAKVLFCESIRAAYVARRGWAQQGNEASICGMLGGHCASGITPCTCACCLQSLYSHGGTRGHVADWGVPTQWCQTP